MISFAGFPAGKTRFTPLPDLFFTELLSAIDDLAELKLTLYMFWSLNHQRGYPRYMTQAELEAESQLLASLQRAREGDPAAILRDAVEQAVARGSLLRITISNESQQSDYLFLNTPQGRKAVEQIKSGELVLETTGYVREAHVERESPRIFELYEQNIGLLQPLLAEELAEAELTYPVAWVVDAFRIAAEHNVRNWRYIRSILERWLRDGKDDEGPSPREGRRRGYAPWDRRS